MLFTWKTQWPLAVLFFLVFFAIEGLYLSSSLLKVRCSITQYHTYGIATVCFCVMCLYVFVCVVGNVHHACPQVPNGGWFPLALAAVYGLLMMTWYYGTSRKKRYVEKNTVVLDVRGVCCMCLQYTVCEKPYTHTLAATLALLLLQDLIDWQPEQLDTVHNTLYGERLLHRATGHMLQQTNGVGLFFSPQLHGTPQTLVDFVARFKSVPKLTFVVTNRYGQISCNNMRKEVDSLLLRMHTTPMQPQHQCNHNTNATTTPMQPQHQCNHNTNATTTPMQPQHQCSHNTNATTCTTRFVSVPYVQDDDRVLIEPLTIPGFYHVVARYGYMEKIQQNDEFARRYCICVCVCVE